MPRATAALLASGRSLALTSHAVAIVAAINLAHSKLFLAPLAIWPVTIYYGYRVALDAELFPLLPAHAPEVDALLLQIGTVHAIPNSRNDAHIRPQIPNSRTMEDRCRGAVRLHRALLLTVVLQLIALLAALIAA